MRTPPVMSRVMIRLLAATALAGSPLAAEDITCLDGKVISGVVSISKKPNGLTLMTATAMVTVRFTNLAPALRTQYGYDPFEAGWYDAGHVQSATPQPTDAFALSQLDQAKAKALATNSCLGFILVWDGFFGKPCDLTSSSSSSALAQFTTCFKDSLVLVYVRHESELGSIPAAVKLGFMGPDEGGYAPTMAVIDPRGQDYICEIPLGGPNSNGALRLKLFRTGIDRIKAYRASHDPAVAGATPSTAPAAAGSPGGSAVPATTPSGPVAAAPVAVSPAPTPPVSYQEITLTDGRVLKGHVDADHTTITLINLTSGRAEGSLPITPEQIASIVVRTLQPATDAVDGLSPQARMLANAERALLASVSALNQAKQLSADTIQEDLIWDRTVAKQELHSQSEADTMHARLDNLHHRLATTQAAVPVAKTVYEHALAAYRALGGTRDVAALLTEPPTPK